MAWRLQGLQTRMTRCVAAGETSWTSCSRASACPSGWEMCGGSPTCATRTEEVPHVQCCGIWGAHVGDCEEKCLLWSDALYFGRDLRTFRRNWDGGSSERFVQPAGSHIARGSLLHYHTLYYKTVNPYEQHRVIKVLSHILYTYIVKIYVVFYTRSEVLTVRNIK